MPGYYDSDVIGAGGIRTPGVVMSEMRTVEQGIKSLGADIQRAQNASKLPEGFMSEWIAFRVEWDRFFDSNSSWISRATNSVYDKTIEFRDRLQSWRDNFVRVGGNPTAPALPETGKFPVAAVLIGVGIVGFGMWYLFKADHT